MELANEHMERSSITVTIRKPHTKTTMIHHYTPSKMVKMKNINNAKCWQLWRNEITHTLLMERPNGTITLESFF